MHANKMPLRTPVLPRQRCEMGYMQSLQAERIGFASALLSNDCRETLPMHAMDEAIRLHHSLIRKLLAKHYGYESATEGDAFIMGFHTARQAVQFACDLQQQLMTQPWPEEVLKFHVSAPVWAQVRGI